MSITLDLPQALEKKLSTEAARQGISLTEYLLQLLASERTSDDIVKTGEELVSYWQKETLIGSRPNIFDSQNHARQIREKAQKRMKE